MRLLLYRVKQVYDFCIMLVVAAIAALLYRRFNIMQVHLCPNNLSFLRLTPPKLWYLIMTVFSQTGDNDAGLGDWMAEILIWHAVIFALVFCDPSTGSLLLLYCRAVFNYDLGVSDWPGIFIIMSMEVANQYTDPDTGFKVTINSLKVVTSCFWFRWFLELKDLMEPGENLSAWGRVMCLRLLFKTMQLHTY